MDADLQRQFNPALAQRFKTMYQEHPGWTMHLLHDNLLAACESDEQETIGPVRFEVESVLP